MVEATGTSEVDITVRLSGTTKKGIETVLVGTSRAQAGTWFASYYDVSKFLKDVKSDEITVTILVSPTDGSGEVSDLWISHITSAEPVRSGFPVWIIFVILGVLLAAGIVVFVIWFKKHYTVVK